MHPAAPPEERVMGAARAYRDAMLAHVNALPIVLVRGPVTPVALRPVELLIGILREAGLPPGHAMAGMNAIAAAVRGVVGMAAQDSSKQQAASNKPDPSGLSAGHAEHPIREQIEARFRDFPSAEFPHLREALHCAGDFFERDFEFGIRALARGLIAEARREGM